MELVRKIERRLMEWKSDPNRLPLIVKGLRQCGKTYSVLKFARAHYVHVVYLNFVERPELKGAFEGSLSVDRILLMVSALYGEPLRFVPHETVVVLDEIQECPQARTALKFFKTDGRYDVIATGSLLGVNGYGDDADSVPVGYETTLTMRALDFEEFLWANAVPEGAVSILRESLQAETPVPASLHERMTELFRQYAVVGGMPAVVKAFLETKNLSVVRQRQTDLLNAYRADITKYALGADKVRIRECFDSIPRQLAKENKKFQYATVRKGARSSQYVGALQWIEDAGLICRCRNVSTTELPLEGFALPDDFKAYVADTGLFVGMLETGTAADILTGNLGIYKGAVFENLAADVLTKMGRPLHHFRKESGLELDFLIRYRGRCVPLTVRPTTGRSKRLKTVLEHPETYRMDSAVRAGDENVGREGAVLTIPLYMLFLLEEPAGETSVDALLG